MKQGKKINLVVLELLCIAVFFGSIFILIPIPASYKIQDNNAALSFIIEIFRFVLAIASYNTAVYLHKLQGNKFLIDIFHYKIDRPKKS